MSKKSDGTSRVYCNPIEKGNLLQCSHILTKSKDHFNTLCATKDEKQCRNAAKNGCWPKCETTSILL